MSYLELFKSLSPDRRDFVDKIFDEMNNRNTAKYDLSVYVDDSESILKGQFNYATKLFSPETMHRFISNKELLKNRHVPRV